MDSTTKRYTPRDVRLALQLAGKDIGPIILVKRYDPVLVDQGMPAATRICSGCGGSREEGVVTRIPGTERWGPEVNENEKWQCCNCQRRADRLRIDPILVERMRNSIYAHYDFPTHEYRDREYCLNHDTVGECADADTCTPGSERTYHGPGWSSD